MPQLSHPPMTPDPPRPDRESPFLNPACAAIALTMTRMFWFAEAVASIRPTSRCGRSCGLGVSPATPRQRHSAYDGAMATSPKAHRVEALRRKQSELRKKVAKSTSDVALNRGKAADCRTAAANSRSTATAKSKIRQADQHEAKAIAAERTRAKLESEIARRDAELIRALGEVDKERESEGRRTREEG